jgi:two-component system phosphate regulon sensor histidine kinase PhoR
MSVRWAPEFWRIALIVALAWLIGMLLGHPGTCIAVGLAGLLAWHLVQLRQLALWLIKGSAHESPSAGGMWGQVIDAVMRLRKCSRKRMLSALLTRFRESAAAMPDAVVIINAVGEMEWLNDAATRLLGARGRTSEDG